MSFFSAGSRVRVRPGFASGAAGIPSAVNRPANPGLLVYGSTSGSASAWAHPGALVITSRSDYDDAAFLTMAAGGATVINYLDVVINTEAHFDGGRYHDMLFESNGLGGAVPLWPGNPVANGSGSLNDFRVGSVLHDKLPGVLAAIRDENPHIAGLFMDDLGTRSWFPNFDFDAWSSTDKEAYRNGAIAVMQAVRTFADANDWFIMVNGTWSAATGTVGSGGYPTRNAHGCSLADGGFIENHDPGSELAVWTAYASPSAQWGAATPRGIGYNWFSNTGDPTKRAAWVTANLAAWASSQADYTDPIGTPWGSFTDFGLPRRT